MVKHKLTDILLETNTEQPEVPSVNMFFEYNQPKIYLLTEHSQIGQKIVDSSVLNNHNLPPIRWDSLSSDEQNNHFAG